MFDTPLLLAKNEGLTFDQRLAKRVLDLVVSIIALVITSPVMLVIAIAIKAYDGGPVFLSRIVVRSTERYLRSISSEV